MIKRYKKFINESVDSFEKKQEIELFRDRFYTAILEIEEGTSFSVLCKRRNADPYIDYSNMQKEMDDLGFSLTTIKNLFSDEFNELSGLDIFEFISQRSLDGISGNVDIYLYYTIEKLGLDKNRYELGGYGWSTIIGDDDYSGEESIIRYGYGYHKTKYGKLMLENSGITEDEFRRSAHLGLSKEIINNWSGIFIPNFGSDNYRNSYYKMDDFVIIEPDRFIIFTKKLSDAIIKESNDGKIKDFFPLITPEGITNSFINFLEIYDFNDYDVTRDELVIYLESRPEDLKNI